jgi:hypothetical protein
VAALLPALPHPTVDGIARQPYKPARRNVAGRAFLRRIDRRETSEFAYHGFSSFRDAESSVKMTLSGNPYESMACIQKVIGR